jgi:hypothetical protein
MAADAWVFYNTARERIGDGSFDLDNDSFKVILLDSGYTPDVENHADYGDISADELATANGYTAGGAALGSVTWTRSTTEVVFDSADPQWSASGGSIVCRYAAIYDDTHGSDGLVCYSLLDNTPADVTTTDGNDLNILLSANGIFKAT